MWEKTKAELDALFQKNNKMMVERRCSARWNQFTSHLDYLHSFGAVLSRVIRPAMTAFGKYVEGMGHKYYIESGEELVEGYLLPISHITLHILLNVYDGPGQGLSHSITFKTDSSRAIYLFRKTGGYGAEKTGLTTACRYSVGRYDLNQITPELVESHLKDFLIEAILVKPQHMTARRDMQGSYHGGERVGS